MTIKQMEKHYLQYGIFIFEQFDKNDGRKKYYKVSYPIFEDGKEIPVSNKEILVKKPSDAKKYIDSVLFANSKYKEQCEQWLRNH